MFGKKFLVSLVAAGSSVTLSVPAFAGLKEGDMAFKVGGAYIVPDESSLKLETRKEVKFKKDTNPVTAGVDFLFMATDEIGINLGTSFPAKVKQKVSFNGYKGSYEYKIWPWHATAQYFFLTPQDEFRPYIGAGFHYTDFKDSKIDGHDLKKVDFDKEYGFLFQVGGVFNFDDDMFIDASARYFYLEPDGHAHTKVQTSPQEVEIKSYKIKSYKINPWMFNISFGMKF